jgi:hypothetical protein
VQSHKELIENLLWISSYISDRMLACNQNQKINNNINESHSNSLISHIELEKKRKKAKTVVKKKDRLQWSKVDHK